jgi:hypothetical protein
MKNTTMKLTLSAMLAASLTLGGCSQETAQEAPNEQPQVQKASLTAEMRSFVAPEMEDALLFRDRLEDGYTVPDAVKPALQQAVSTKKVRKFPYPYRCMLAISSDIDDTTPEEFAEYHRFLNTKEQTPYGPGVGLDVGDSMWFYMGNDQPNVTDKSGHKLEGVMTYFDYTDTSKKRFADQIIHYWKAGWIDSAHTFGDFSRKNVKDISFKREYAIAAWDEMKKNGIDLKVWINHGNEANVDAFGAYHPGRFSKYQAGDDPKSPYYHTDLTIKNGVHFVWNSIGEEKFGHNEPVFEISLRDGQKVWGFHRYTHERGFDGRNDWTWIPREIHRQITKERLDALAQNQQYAILAQHLGGYNIGFPFDEKGIAALRLLADYQDMGKVLVARTSRLLNYHIAQKYVQYAYAEHEGEGWLNIIAIQDPLFGPQPLTLDAVRGLTFYVPKPEKTHLLLNMQPVPASEYQFNPADESGQKSIGIKWFKPDHTDYSKQFTSTP